MAALSCHCHAATRWWRRTAKVEHGDYCAKAPAPPTVPAFRAGQTYIVGDRGPELLVLGRSGTVWRR